MPAAARALKKYLGATSVSTICDKEETTAALGYSEVASVQHKPGDVVGARASACKSGVCPAPRRNCWKSSGKPAQHDRKVSPAIGAEQTGDIFDNNPSWLTASKKSVPREEEARSRASQARAASGHAKVLAGEPADPYVGFGKLCCVDMGNISIIGNIAPVACEDAAGGRIIFHLADNRTTCVCKPAIKPADPGEEGQHSARGM